jgi:hypothetical protein
VGVAPVLFWGYTLSLFCTAEQAAEKVGFGMF